MTSLGQSIHLTATAPTVWAFVTRPENFCEYVDGYVRGRVLGNSSTGIGAAYEWHGAFGPIELRARERVVAWEDGRRVQYEGRMAGARFRSEMSVESRDHGCELFVSIEQDTPLWMGGSWTDQLLVKPLVARSIRRSLRRLAARFGTLPT